MFTVIIPASLTVASMMTGYVSTVVPAIDSIDLVLVTFPVELDVLG